MKYSRVSVSGLNIFYREAGDPSNPVMILFHGFPFFAETFSVDVTVLADDAHDFVGVLESDSEAYGCAVIEDVHEELSDAHLRNEAVNDFRDVVE